VSGPGNHHHKSIAVLRCITVYDTIPMDSIQVQLELCICIDQQHNGRDFDCTPITVRSSIVQKSDKVSSKQIPFFATHPFDSHNCSKI
jgi:hypothetical protein